MIREIKGINDIFIYKTYNKSITYEDIIKNKILLTNKKISSPIPSPIPSPISSLTYKNLSSYTPPPIIQLVENKNRGLITSSQEFSPIINLNSPIKITRISSSTSDINEECHNNNFTRLVSVPSEFINIPKSHNTSDINEECHNNNFTRLVSEPSEFINIPKSHNTSPINQLVSSKKASIIQSHKTTYNKTLYKLRPMKSPELSPIIPSYLKKNISSSKNNIIDTYCDVEKLVPNNYLIKKNRSMSCDSILNYYLYKNNFIRRMYNKSVAIKDII